MEQSILELREQRLQKLFADCQREVLSQIIGPFGLSTAMFEDKNGGNVTTLRNFERTDDDFVATESDKALHANSRREYNVDVRSEYEIKTDGAAKAAGGRTWEQKRTEKIARGKDEYSGQAVSADGTIELRDGRVVRAELDHVGSVGEFHSNKKAHLGLGDVNRDEQTGELKVDPSRMRAAVNDDKNLALTNQPLNGSKSDHDLEEWAARERADGTTNAEKFEIDEKLMTEKSQTAKKHLDSTVDRAVLKKQTAEILHTGGSQALKMGLRQAMGVLLTELVNGLFNEIKTLIKHGIEAGKSLFEEIRDRLFKAIQSVAKKIPDAAAQLFHGGVSGFMSNLLTFVLNSFLSTGKRFVTAIREGLIGLFRAFKMILFPPKHLTGDEALQEGLKILTAVVISSVGIVLAESVATFMASVPFLKVIADVVAPAVMGILTGLMTAFLSYQIDCMFDRYRHSLNEKLLDEIIADAKHQGTFANELTTLAENSFSNVESFAESVSIYQNIGDTLGAAGRTSANSLAILGHSIAETREQIRKSTNMIAFVNESQTSIDEFFKTN
ncbi:hypothetical protein [Paraburkholderia fungorum]|uniref:Uncharacterized protein n=1 Tax=Paraburkholderia fungorum TaxID=134537 RepID=A0A3R7E413_9BURK|nr:hypothetical protein [Paraburkholderia fungorum]RKF36731.1 hypothetical protein BCY88_35440 [Paraburkholderia fungorum]